MNTLENNHDVKLGQEWERVMRELSKRVSKMLHGIFAIAGDDLEYLASFWVSLMHERNKMLRHLRRAGGFRYIQGKFTRSPSGAVRADATSNDVLKLLLMFKAYNKLNWMLTVAQAKWMNTDSTTGAILLDDDNDPIEVGGLNTDLLREHICIALERFIKETTLALVIFGSDTGDNHRIVNLLCGRTYRRTSLVRSNRLRKALEAGHGREGSEEALLKEAQAQVAIELADAKEIKNFENRVDWVASLQNAVARGVEKVNALAPALKPQQIEELKQAQVQDYLSHEEQFLTGEMIEGLLSLLSNRQRQVCELTLAGYSDSEIGEWLEIEPNTVNAHRHKYKIKIRSYLKERP